MKCKLIGIVCAVVLGFSCFANPVKILFQADQALINILGFKITIIQVNSKKYMVVEKVTKVASNTRNGQIPAVSNAISVVELKDE
jgi:hypothetical protein